MEGNGKSSSKRLYRIVGIIPGGARTVLMTGMELEQANSARGALAKEREFVWVIVEREGETGSVPGWDPSRTSLSRLDLPTGGPATVTDDRGAPMHDKDQIARRYGFESYAALLDISDPLPNLPGDTAQCYIARHPNGNWFLWDDGPPSSPPAESP
jgi:hypothetical protein